MFCNHKNIFGLPKKGFHEERLFGFARNDIIGTIIISYFISKILKITLLNSLLYCLLFAIIIHKLFCVDTALNSLLFN